jgi:N-methylhydantoinase A
MTFNVGSSAPLSVAVDTGGTFTDVTLLDRASGRMWTAKTPSTPADPSIGFMNGVRAALDLANLQYDQVGQIVHGTTVATNLILEGKGAISGLLTNAGFRHLLEIGRHDIPRASNMYSWVKPARPIPPERIFEVGGLVGPKGAEIEPLDLEAVRSGVEQMRRLGVRSVAICFLHSYANPRHEQQARDVVLEMWPEALVTISSEVLPVLREFERSMATVLNAYVMPAVSTYVGQIEKKLEQKKARAPLLLMKSNGGITGPQTIRREPVQTALSGPAAGVIGAQLIARLAGFPDIISVDIGGTSADISLIRNGEPGMTSRGRVGEWPLSLPMIDINTIGAGGGSIARVSADGLTVGPESAGAFPGPVAYRRGGVEPTVSDAHLTLGTLPPSLLNGAMALDVDAARKAIQERIAGPLGLSLEAAARGILAVVDNAMVGAIRVVSVGRGLDPRDFVLVPFGGAGPLHGGSLARLLGIRTILIPPAPGVLSSIGLLVSNLKADFSRSRLQVPPHYDLADMEATFVDLEREATAWLEEEGMPPEGRSMQRFASLRYLYQGFELRIAFKGERVEERTLADLIAGFHCEHETLYTFAQEDVPVEIVTLHVEAVGKLERPRLPVLAVGKDPELAIIGRQAVHFEEGTRVCPLYDRAQLGAEAEIAGPAIFVQLDSTAVMLPGQVAKVDRYGNLVISEQSRA